MSKKTEKERPGVVFRFQWLPSLEKMSDKAKAKFLMSSLYRGQNLLYEPDFEDLADDPRDYVRFETLWEQAGPLIDEDGDGWRDGILQRRYASYCKSEKAMQREPMQYEDYKYWYETKQAREQEEL